MKDNVSEIILSLPHRLSRFCFINTKQVNEKYLKIIEKFNKGIAIKYYRENNKRGEAIKISNNNILEIFKVYLYEKDFESAKLFIQQQTLKKKYFNYLFDYVEIHNYLTETMFFSCFDIRLIKLVSSCIKKKFSIDLIEIIKDFHKKYCKSCCCVKKSMKILQEFVSIKKLNYYELEYCYNTFNNIIYLKEMIYNPFISKEYYYEYAKIEGIKEEDIDRILNTVFRGWAFKIALTKNWIKPSYRRVIENILEGPKIIFLNKNWGNKQEDNIIISD